MTYSLRNYLWSYTTSSLYNINVCICNSKIRELIKKYSYSIYLKVNLGTLEKRLKHNSKRPLLKNVNKKQKLEEIYREREKYYNSANLIVDNEDKQKSIKKIIEILKINE